MIQGERYRAGCPKLGARLMAVVELISLGANVADVGCDHGKLSVYLALQGKANKVIAIDKRPMPLARARALVQQTDCSDIVDCRLGDGLAVLKPEEADTIVVAGMSGETMVHILQSAPWVKDKNKQLLLVPTTQHGFIRKWLLEQGFTITKEVPVEEKGRFYTALSAVYTGSISEATPLFCCLGLIAEANSSAAKGYINARLNHLRKQEKANLTEEERKQLEKLIAEVNACLL